MSMAEPLIPHPDRDVEDVRDDLDLQPHQPDILGGPLESELNDGVESVPGSPEPESPVHRDRDLPIRKPAVGEQLTEAQLEAELENE